MKITIEQLRRVIREEVQNLTEALKDGGVVNRDSGEILDMDQVPPQFRDYVEVDDMGYTTLPHDKFEELRGELKRSSAGKPKKQWKAPFQTRPASFARGDSPDPQDVHDAFLKLRDYRGEVPIQNLADELGVHVNRIDFNGTGLRVLNTIVTELL